jgi:hypothetical protein
VRGEEFRLGEHRLAQETHAMVTANLRRVDDHIRGRDFDRHYGGAAFVCFLQLSTTLLIESEHQKPLGAGLIFWSSL